MKSIFWKIFLSFWLVMALVLGITLRISFHLASERAAQVSELRRIDITRAAEVALEQGGREGFSNWLKEEAVLPPTQTIYLVDDDGNDILQRSLPQDVRTGFKRHRQRRGRNGRNSRWQRLSDPDGNSYLFVFGPTRPPLLGILSTPGVTSVLFLVALLVSALVCFVLTRYVTAPLRPVMSAARKLSAGELDARAGSKHRRNDELGELASQFDDMAEALQTQIESRQTMLRNVSHELRSPLARILVALELAERQPDKTAQQLARIEQEAQHMETLTKQILDLARAQTAPENRSLTNLAEVLRQICDDAIFEGRPDNKSVTLTCDSHSSIVSGDESLMHSAFENIIRNALRFSPAGDIVEVAINRQGDRIQVRISDNGPGLGDIDPDKLFEPFFKGPDSSGSGVGLALSAQIVALHGGSIKAENQQLPKTGLIMTVSLPAAS